MKSENLKSAEDYLKNGSPFGGKSVLALIEQAIEGINGPPGIGPAIYNCKQAITLLAHTIGHLEAELQLNNYKRELKSRRKK